MRDSERTLCRRSAVCMNICDEGGGELFVMDVIIETSLAHDSVFCRLRLGLSTTVFRLLVSRSIGLKLPERGAQKRPQNPHAKGDRLLFPFLMFILLPEIRSVK